jgi:hypothetical protein
MEQVVVVTRSFQAGTGKNGKPFDTEWFAKKVAHPISRLIKFDEVIRSIAVVINAEPNNPLAEIQTKGLTPTMNALRDRFPEEIKEKRIIPHLCTSWGPNPGSGNALNEGADIARKSPDIKWVLHWSPEIEMDGYRIQEALGHAEGRNLSVVGILREQWWAKTQWLIAQNTASIWDLEKLKRVEGFSPQCNGTGRTIRTESLGEVPLAGMEDFHAMLRMMKQDILFRWGMCGRSNPLFWDTSFPLGSERERRHLAKIERQFGVMQAWAKDVFPELTFEQVMNRFFECYHQS